MTDPDLSIIIATRSRPQLLRRALASLAHQGTPTCQIEVLVADNSDDRYAWDAVLEFNTQEPEHVTAAWCHSWPPGRTVAINLGCELARGTYIGWLDDDDEAIQGAPGLAVQYMKLNPDCDMVCGHAVVVEEDGTHKAILLSSSLAKLAKKNSGGAIWAAIMKKEVMTTVGRSDPRFWPADDLEFWLRVYYSGFRNAVLPFVLLAHHLHGQNASTTEVDRHIELYIATQERYQLAVAANIERPWMAGIDPPGFVMP